MFRIVVAFAILCATGFSIAAETQILANQDTAGKTLSQVSGLVKVLCDAEVGQHHLPPHVNADLSQVCALIRVPVVPK